jgi:hypothetical protein
MILVQRGETRIERLVEVRGEAMRVSIVPATPANSTALAPEPPPAKAKSGLSPTWFYAATGVTAVLAGATVWSGFDAVSRHDEFVSSGCAPGATVAKPADCHTRADEGASATLRTNVLLGTTIALAAVTATMGVFFVRWGGSSVAVGGHFR